jgi:putative SOS response-associated peptidase YedK
MPAILAPDAYALWLAPGSDPDALAELLRPNPLAFARRPVGTRVNRVEHDDAELLDAVPEPPRQPSLF